MKMLAFNDLNLTYLRVNHIKTGHVFLELN